MSSPLARSPLPRGDEPTTPVDLESRSRPEIPTTVAGRYKVLSKIAEGGMGVVFRAEHLLSRKKLAVKILHPHLSHGRQAVERFKAEVSAAAEIDHPGIVQVFDAGVDTDGSFYMAMELLEGESLGARLRRQWPGTRTAVGIVLSLCEPLAQAHARGFVHRDLKPDNIFVATEPDGTERVKLLDFGLVREVSRRGPTVSGITFGTPEYMSPEQAMSAKKADVPSDVWSVGVMLYELLAGDHPFTGETPTAVMANAIKDPHSPLRDRASHVPAELAVIVERCLEKDPTKRFATAGELGSALRALTETIDLDDRAPLNPRIRDVDDPDASEPPEGPRAPLVTTAVSGVGRQPPASTLGLPRRSSVLTLAAAAAISILVLSVSVAVFVGRLPERPAQTTTLPVLPRPAVAASATAPVAAQPSVAVAAEPTVVAPVVDPATSQVDSVVTGVEVPAERSVARSRSRRSRAHVADDQTTSSPTVAAVPDEQAAISGPVAEARACLARRDTQCAMQALAGARSADELALLVDVYNAQGRSADAQATMQRYLERYPRGRAANGYRRVLGLDQ